MSSDLADLTPDEQLQLFETANRCCIRLVRKTHEWLREHGTPAGRKAWVAKAEKDLKTRRAATAAYRLALYHAEEEDELFGYTCSEGRPCSVVRDKLGGTAQPCLTDAYCGSQETCPRYWAKEQALVEISRLPKVFA